jgi:hypothetical protein
MWESNMMDVGKVFPDGTGVRDKVVTVRGLDFQMFREIDGRICQNESGAALMILSEE